MLDQCQSHQWVKDFYVHNWHILPSLETPCHILSMSVVLSIETPRKKTKKVRKEKLVILKSKFKLLEKFSRKNV